MASFRRAQSPAYHHHTRTPFSLSSSSHKLLHGSNYSSTSPQPHFIGSLRRFLDSIFIQRSRKGSTSSSNHHSWRRPFFRFLVCFVLGFVIGFGQFGFVDDDNVKHGEFEFLSEIKPRYGGVRGEKIVLETVKLGVGVGGLEDLKEDGFRGVRQLIVVTPTYNRVLQGYFLSRLSQVLRLTKPPVLWVVVEYNAASMETSEILRRSGVMYRLLVCTKNSTNVKDRGVHQRNTALEHIGRHKLDGIVYFADDDNIYSLELFESLREIRRFGTWPVAMLAQSKNKAILEGPVCNGSQVIGWHTNEKSKRLRRFHVDMSGFAFNSTILWDPKRWLRPMSDSIRQLDSVKEGFQETTFIEQVVEDETQMEGIPNECLRVMNWHLHLESHNLAYPSGWFLQKNLDVILPLK
ncbi:hypothetical protein GIB67_015216 [Kingdonia uniflora]|uniref:Glycosyltransferases n=1 Tax=Kingdonia uniflora TaxID=39325 RepID=A0A7J7MT03_9MAGN|nr:hypothetical protein GIB67_015216 [Kingdonia uniflora]